MIQVIKYILLKAEKQSSHIFLKKVIGLKRTVNKTINKDYKKLCIFNFIVPFANHRWVRLRGLGLHETLTAIKHIEIYVMSKHIQAVQA